MLWSTTPPAPIVKPGWTTDSAIAAPVVMQRWAAKYSRRAGGTGLGADAAAILPRFPALDAGLGTDTALLDAAGMLAFDVGLGADRAAALPRFAVVDAGVGVDLARLGARPSDAGIGADRALLPRLLTLLHDGGLGADAALVPKVGASAFDTGLGADSAAGLFTAHAPAPTAITTIGAYTYPIPVWCRYIDVVLLGGGGGGEGGGWGLPGGGGYGGLWAWVTLERGVDIAWAVKQITGSVPDGGNGGGSGPIPGGGSAGGNATATPTGGSTVTANGGAGRSGAGGSNQAGFLTSNGNTNGGRDLLLNGVTYTAGALVTSGNGGAGNPPGGPGRGANSFSGSPAGKGARGQVWFRAYQ